MLTNFTKNSILDCQLSSACTSGQIYKLILHLYWPEHQKGLVPRLNGLMHLLKLIKRLCTKLVLALVGYILSQIFKMKYKTYAYWTDKKLKKWNKKKKKNLILKIYFKINQNVNSGLILKQADLKTNCTRLWRFVLMITYIMLTQKYFCPWFKSIFKIVYRVWLMN